MLTPRPGRHPMLMPFLFVAGGIGVLGWYGMDWRALPQYSEADIEASVELNFMADLSRAGHLDEPGRQRLKARVREEVRADIRRERGEVERGLGVGLICIVVGLGHAVLMSGLKKTGQ